MKTDTPTTINPMHVYLELVQTLADGNEADAIETEAIVHAAGKTLADLEADVADAVTVRAETAW